MIVSLAIMAFSTVAASIALTKSLMGATSNLAVHAEALASGQIIEPSSKFSTTAIVEEINAIRPISFWVGGSALATLFATVIVIVWMNRQRIRQGRLAEHSVNLADQLLLTEASERQRIKEMQGLIQDQCHIN